MISKYNFERPPFCGGSTFKAGNGKRLPDSNGLLRLKTCQIRRYTVNSTSKEGATTTKLSMGALPHDLTRQVKSQVKNVQITSICRLSVFMYCV